MSEWKPSLCLYHGGCTDGFGAAWAIWNRWPSCKFIGVDHGEPLPDVAGEDILFVDFAPKIDWIWANSFKSKSMVIIDHHKSARADLERLVHFDGTMEALDGAFKMNWTQNTPELAAWFDLNHSGAVLAWKFAYPGADIPDILRYIEDRDLWNWKLEGTRNILAGLDSYPMDFEIWSQLRWNLGELAHGGSWINKAFQNDVKKLLTESYLRTVGGYPDIPVVNCPFMFSSDVGNQLLAKYPEAPFSATWYLRADGKTKWSLRSEDGRADVSEIARANRGGGLRNAAGFEVE